MTKSLGKTLKESRELIPMTLRQVENVTGISNAYLSQLENDKIKKPSANVLYKLASVYNLELDVLLMASGIISNNDGDQNKRSSLLTNLAFSSANLTPEEEEKVLEYIKFLRYSNK